MLHDSLLYLLLSAQKLWYASVPTCLRREEEEEEEESLGECKVQLHGVE